MGILLYQITWISRYMELLYIYIYIQCAAKPRCPPPRWRQGRVGLWSWAVILWSDDPMKLWSWLLNLWTDDPAAKINENLLTINESSTKNSMKNQWKRMNKSITNQRKIYQKSMNINEKVDQNQSKIDQKSMKIEVRRGSGRILALKRVLGGVWAAHKSEIVANMAPSWLPKRSQNR